MKVGEKVLESFKTFTQLSARLKKLFIRVVVGFGPKGMPGRMCDSVH